MNVISNILYWISTGLLVPVIVLLIFFFVRAVILAGSFFGQYLSMRKGSEAMDARIKKLSAGSLPEFELSLGKAGALPVVPYMQKVIAAKGDAPRIDLLVGEFELAADKELSLSRTLTKMGPILGLMGTLIPMGPALVGLATGDIASMAYNMQVAFATTVVGLLVSAVGFLTQQVKERWAVRQLTQLEFVADIVKVSTPGVDSVKTVCA